MRDLALARTIRTDFTPRVKSQASRTAPMSAGLEGCDAGATSAIDLRIGNARANRKLSYADLLDSEKFDIEDQRRVRRNPRSAGRTVRELWRKNETALTANLHSYHAPHPPTDDLPGRDRNRDRLPPNRRFE